MKPMLLAENGAALEGAITITDDGWWLPACRASLWEGSVSRTENWDFAPHEYRYREGAIAWIMEQAELRRFSDFRPDEVTERH